MHCVITNVLKYEIFKNVSLKVLFIVCLTNEENHLKCVQENKQADDSVP